MTEALRPILEIVGEENDVEGTPLDMDTPTTSNISLQQPFEASRAKRFVNMPELEPMSPSTEIITEATREIRDGEM